MRSSLLTQKLIILLCLLGLIAAQCEPEPLPTAPPSSQPISPPPTPLLIPPIQPGDGSDLMDQLLEQGLIRVGLRVWPEASFSPPAFRGGSNAATGGALNGFEVELAHMIAENLGLELELIEAYPPVIARGDWGGQWNIALASLVPFDQPPQAPPGVLRFSNPYAYMPMGVLIPAGAANIESLADLAGRPVGVLADSAYQDLLTPAGSTLTVQAQPLIDPIPVEVRLVSLSNLPKAMRELGEPGSETAAQVEAIVGPAPMFAAAVQQGNPVQLTLQGERVGYQPLAIAVVPPQGLEVDRLLLEINKILERLQDRGALAELSLRWYNQDLSRPPPERR